MMQPNTRRAINSRTLSSVVTPPEAITGKGTASARAASPSTFGPASFGPVQVNQVEGASPFADPPPGHAHRVVTEHRLAGVIPLRQADALAAAQVDRRQDQHRSVPRVSVGRAGSV